MTTQPFSAWNSLLVHALSQELSALDGSEPDVRNDQKWVYARGLGEKRARMKFLCQNWLGVVENDISVQFPISRGSALHLPGGGGLQCPQTPSCVDL